MNFAIALICSAASNIVSVTNTHLTNAEITVRRTNHITFEFRGIKLGMRKEEVDKVVDSDPILVKDERSALGLIDETKPFLMKLKGEPYIKRMYLHFYSGAVYLVSIKFNSELFSFQKFLDVFSSRYGQPDIARSRYAVWFDQTTDVELRLEKPAVVKFFYKSILEKMYSHHTNVLKTLKTPSQRMIEDILTDLTN